MQKRIIILEDDVHIGYILELFLQTEGFEVSLCTTISQLQQSSDNELPDVFLLDIMVPDGNGLLFCRQLKQDPDKKHIPVLMMSAHLGSKNVDQDAGADGFIAKPFDLDTLADLLKKHVGTAAS